MIVAMVERGNQDDDPWIECTATVTGCKRTFETSVDETSPRMMSMSYPSTWSPLNIRLTGRHTAESIGLNGR